MTAPQKAKTVKTDPISLKWIIPSKNQSSPTENPPAQQPLRRTGQREAPPRRMAVAQSRYPTIRPTLKQSAPRLSSTSVPPFRTVPTSNNHLSDSLPHKKNRRRNHTQRARRRNPTQRACRAPVTEKTSAPDGMPHGTFIPQSATLLSPRQSALPHTRFQLVTHLNNRAPPDTAPAARAILSPSLQPQKKRSPRFGDRRWMISDSARAPQTTSSCLRWSSWQPWERQSWLQP